MLPTTNFTATVQHLETATSKRTYATAHLTGLAVFVMQDGEDVLAGGNGDNDYTPHTMLVSNSPDILVGDKITLNDSRVFYVSGTLVHDTVAFKHTQVAITNVFD